MIRSSQLHPRRRSPRRIGPVVLAISLAAALLGWGAAMRAQAPPPLEAPESHRFGVVDDLFVTSPDAAALMRQAGFGWANYWLYWNKANPADGVYDWTGPDAELAFLRNAGLNVFVRIVFPPTWTTGASYGNEEAPYFCLDENNPPTNVRNHPDCHNPALRPNVAAFRAFVRAAVARYKHAVRAWGVGVEAHSRVFWQGDLEQFAREVLRPGYEEIKAIDPGAIVVGPDEDLGGALFTLLSLENTVGRFCDVVSYHLLSHSGGGVARLDSELKPVVDQVGRGRPVWLTELGYRSANAAGNQVQAQWLSDMLAGIRLRPWIDKTFVFRMLEKSSPYEFGLLDADLTPRPAYTAVRQFAAAQAPPRFAFLAEGASGPFFDLDVALANPNQVEAPVKLSFLRQDGAVVTRSFVMAARARSTVNVDAVPGLDATAVSTVVESTTGVPLVAERTMIWDANGYGGHGGSAVGQPDRRWYFAEGSQGFFDTFVLLANSNLTPALVTVRFLLENGAPIETQYVVNPNSRVTVWGALVAGLPGNSFSIVVDADLPIIAERAMYFGNQGRQWEGGHESAGVAALATSWFLAEGATGPFFDEYVLVGNPGSTDALVTLSFLLPDGTRIDRPTVVPAQARRTFNVETLDPGLANTAVSTTVTSDTPIVVERAMYWADGAWREAHNSFGVTGTGLRWGLAEGRIGGARNFQTYILLANPSDQPAEVRITFLRPDGLPTAPLTRTVLPTSRLNIEPGHLPPDVHAAGTFGTLVESTNGVPIVVESAMYWDEPGRFWSGGTNVTATRLP
jgi:hypothetical protein